MAAPRRPPLHPSPAKAAVASPPKLGKDAAAARGLRGHTRQAYTNDVALKGQRPHLSLQQARNAQNRNHPRRHLKLNELAEVIEYGLFSPWRLRTGMYGCEAQCCRNVCGPPASDFVPYGIGVALYFRFLKYMALVFFIASLLAMPNMLLMYSGRKLEGEIVTTLDQLSLLTMGNLGEGVDVCASALDGGTVEITCPPGSTIGNVQAYYGLPSGSCGCPAALQPSRETGECDGGNVDGATCLPSGSYCHLDVDREVSTPSGNEFQAGTCCAHQLVDNRPDFAWLSVVLNAHCNALGASTVAQGRCLGQDTCTIPAQTSNITWTPSVAFNTLCPEGSAELPNGDCSYLMDPTGALSSCVWPNSTLQDPFEFDVESFGVRNPTPDTYFVRFTDGTTTITTEEPVNGLATAGVREIFPISRAVQMYAPVQPDPGQHRLMVTAQCFDTSVFVLDRTFTKNEVAVFLGMFDAIIVIFLLFAVLMLAEFERQGFPGFKDVSAADYSVFMPKLPPHDNITGLEQLLQKHFTAVVASAPQVDKPLENPRVADISFALANTEVVELLANRGGVLKRLDKANQSMQLCRKQGIEGKEMDKHRKTVNKLHARLKQMDLVINARESAKNNQKAVSAYITFEEEEACLRALETYPQSTLLYCCCQGRNKRIGQVHPVWIKRADEPTDINWTNLNVSTRVLRLGLTTLITLAVLVLSGVAVFLAEDAKRTVEREYTSADCATFDQDVVANRTLVVQDEFFEDFGATTGRTGLLECHCLSILDVTDPQVLFNAQFDTPSGPRTLCVDWFSTFLQVQVLTYGTAIITLSVNLVLRVILKFVVAFERHKSKTSELLSRAFKMFVLQFLNTAAIVLVINARIDSDFEPLRRGEFTDFSEDWYATVGVSLTLTMLLNIVLPHGFPLFQWIKGKMRRCTDRGCSCDHHRTQQITQRQLNKLYMGPKLLLDERYAQTFNVIFVCLTFSTGLPLLIPIACVSLAVTYWVDKFLFAYVYRTPPRYGSDLAAQFTSLLPYGILLKLVVGFWSLTNGDIFPPASAVSEATSGSALSLNSAEVAAANDATVAQAAAVLDSGSLDFGRRAGESHVFPHLLLISLLLVFLAVVRVFVVNLRRAALAICPCIRFGCGGRARKALQHGKNLPGYFDAIPTEVLRDLAERPVKPSMSDKLQAAVARRWQTLQAREKHMSEYKRLVREAANREMEATSHMQDAERQAFEEMRTMMQQAEAAERAAQAQQHALVAAQRQVRLVDERARRQRVFLVRQEKAGWGAHEEALLSAVVSQGVTWREGFNTMVSTTSGIEANPTFITRIENVMRTVEEDIEVVEGDAPGAAAAAASAAAAIEAAADSGGESEEDKEVAKPPPPPDAVAPPALPPAEVSSPAVGADLPDGSDNEEEEEGGDPEAGDGPSRMSTHVNPSAGEAEASPDHSPTPGRRPSRVVRRTVMELVPREVTERVDPWAATALSAPAPPTSPVLPGGSNFDFAGEGGPTSPASPGTPAPPAPPALLASPSRVMTAEDFLLGQHMFMATTAKDRTAFTAVHHGMDEAGVTGAPTPDSRGLARATSFVEDEEVWELDEEEDLGLLAMAAEGAIRDHEDTADIAAVVEEQLLQEMGSQYVPPTPSGGGAAAGGLSPTARQVGQPPAGPPLHGAVSAFPPGAGGDGVQEWGGTGTVPPPPLEVPELMPSASLVAGMAADTEAAARAHQAEQAAERQKAIAEEFYRRMGLGLKVKMPEEGEVVQMHGQVSYDIFESQAMLSKFGFDTDLPKGLKRRLKDPAGRLHMSRTTVGSIRTLSSGGSMNAPPSNRNSGNAQRFRSRLNARVMGGGRR